MKTTKAEGYADLRSMLDQAEGQKLVFTYLAIMTPSSKNNHTLDYHFRSLTGTELSPQQLAEIHQTVIRNLWDNAHTLEGGVPVWSQPPRFLRSLHWYDWFMVGVFSTLASIALARWVMGGIPL